MSRATFGASWGLSWAILQPPRSHLGLYWAHLVPTLGLPGAILAEFMQNLLGQILCNAKFATANFESKFCVTQNLPRQSLCNTKFASANFAYGLSWAILGPCWGDFGATVGQCWSHLGLSWGYVGVILGIPGVTSPLLHCPPISVKIFANVFR